jgi:hypothetical protein
VPGFSEWLGDPDDPEDFSVTRAAVATDAITNGTFTLTATGLTTGVTGTAEWTMIKTPGGTGALVVMNVPQLSGTSNSTSFGASGIPTFLRPAVGQAVAASSFFITTGSVVTTGTIQVNTAGTLTFYLGTNASGWTASGTKANANMVILYFLS